MKISLWAMVIEDLIPYFFLTKYIVNNTSPITTPLSLLWATVA